jgi:hypothetical protein
MKVILSRKGFDSEYGGQSSPILPDGTLLSLPIPQSDDIVKFTELFYGQKSYYEIIKELNAKNVQINTSTKAHLDPDIRHGCYRHRQENWKPIFGQSGAAQGHLRNQNVSENDIFLFFGSFKQTELINGKLRYKLGSSDLHIIYGYLQVDKIFSFGDTFPDYAKSHSHYAPIHKNLASNCIYVAKENLNFNPNLKGADTLKYSKKLILTKNGMTKSKWQLPEFFKELSISYHTQNSFVDNYFKSAGKGQEFVIQPDIRLTDWVKEILEAY